MNFLKMDGPVMNFLRMVTYYIILQVLFVICCIPIITIGAALAAKYEIAMKLVKDEDEGIVKPFFQAFTKNFKQATPIWLIQLVVYFLIYLDWGWIIDNDITRVPIPYVVAISIITVFAVSIAMVIFPMMVRFKMTLPQLYKGAITFTFMNLFKLVLIIALAVATTLAAIWYFEWLPLILVFSSVAVTYFLATVCNKDFDKVEKQYREEHPEEFEKSSDNETSFKFRGEREEEESEESALDSSYAAARKDLKELETEANKDDRSSSKARASRLEEEKAKLKDMNTKQKLQYFVDYYLGMVLLTVVLFGCVAWFVTDVVKDKMVIMNGGLVNCTMTEAGQEYATAGFMKWGDYSKYKKAKIADTTISFDSYEEYNNRMMDMALYAQINAGMYNYFFMDMTAMELYEEDDLFMVLDEFADISYIPEENLIYNDLNKPIAIQLNDEVKEKLGFPKNADIYIGFLYNSDVLVNANFIEYLFK